MGSPSRQAGAKLRIALAERTAILFPMRSSFWSRPVLLTCMLSLQALTSCGDQTVNQANDDNRAEISSRAAVAPVVRPNAALVSPQAPLGTDSLHFDLYCELDGHVVADPHPNEIIGTYPANARTWHDAAHFIVDLQAMQVCDSSACERYYAARCAWCNDLH
jgi:hypothetical protein